MLLVLDLYIHFSYHFIEHSWFTVSRTSWNAYLIDWVGDTLSATRELPRGKTEISVFHFPGRINKQAKYWKFLDEKSLAARSFSRPHASFDETFPLTDPRQGPRVVKGTGAQRFARKPRHAGITHTHAHVQTSTEFSLVNGSELCAIVSTLWIASNFVVKSALRTLAKGKGHSLPRPWLFGAIFWHPYRAILWHFSLFFLRIIFWYFEGIFRCCTLSTSKIVS